MLPTFFHGLSPFRSLSWLAIAVWAVLPPALLAAADDPPAKYKHGVLIRLEGDITPMLEQYLFRKLEIAQKEGADLVIVEIDSPGGYLEESLEMADKLRKLNWAHTVAYVPKRALSGAAITALGCDEIVMAPQALLGDAGPIFLAEDALFRHAPEKLRSHLAQEIRVLAEAKGRPATLAEAMVDMNMRVFQVENTKTGKTTFMSQREIDATGNPDDWKKIKPVLETGDGHFLEVTGTRAVDLGLAEGNVGDREQLKARYHLEHELHVIEPGWVDTTVYILNLSFVTGLLFVIGLIALYVEFSAPGIGFGGIVAGLCFTLFFWSRFLGGTADWLDVVLFVAGGACIGVELFILPGFGVAGLTGFLLLLASLVLASQRFIIPSNAHQLHDLTNTLLVVVVSGVVFGISSAVLSRYLGAVPLFSKLTLAPPTDSESAAQSTDESEPEALELGAIGVAESALRPAGKARFGPLRIDVVTDGSFITRGSSVRVIEINRNRIVVTEA